MFLLLTFGHVCMLFNASIQKASRKLEEETVRLTALFECGGEMEAHLDAALKKYRGTWLCKCLANL